MLDKTLTTSGMQLMEPPECDDVDRLEFLVVWLQITGGPIECSVRGKVTSQMRNQEVCDPSFTLPSNRFMPAMRPYSNCEKIYSCIDINILNNLHKRVVEIQTMQIDYFFQLATPCK